MYSKQRTIVAGGVTADLKEQVFGDKKKYSFSIAVTEAVKKGDEWEDHVEYFDVEIWNPTEPFLNRLRRYVKKGANVEAELVRRTEKWEDEKGNRRQTVKYRLKSIDLISLPATKMDGSGNNPFPAV